MRRFYYLIAYSFSSQDGTGTGSTKMFFPKQIRSFKDLNDISKVIKERNNFEQVAILSYQLMREGGR